MSKEHLSSPEEGEDVRKVKDSGEGEIIGGERFPKRHQGNKIQSTEGEVSFKQEEGPLCHCGRREEMMSINGGRNQR